MNKKKTIALTLCAVLAIALVAGGVFVYRLHGQRQTQIQMQNEIKRLCMPVFRVVYSNEPGYALALGRVQEAETLAASYLIEDEEIKVLLRDADVYLAGLSENPALNYDAEELKAVVEGVLENKTGNWSVYIEIPGTQFRMEMNNRAVWAASEIKLFNMVTLYDEANKGNVKMTELTKTRMEAMITRSSNSDSNEVVRAIGGGDFFAGADKVTEFAHAIGCTDTQEQHMLFDTNVITPGKNTTSVRDLGTVLRKLYLGECITPEYDAEMIEVLKRQTRRFKIPMGLPAETVVANKTGENSKVELDAAIVYAPKLDYILCISVTDFGNAAVRQTIADVSTAVYDYFNA